MKKRNFEEEILMFITESILENGISPTVREICTALNIPSTSTVHKYIALLKSKGFIESRENCNRSIVLKDDAPNPYMDKIPLVGQVAAGIPITAEENITDYISFSSSRYDKKELFALKVKGDSMVDAAILNGDIVVCFKTPVAENGQIVVAMIDGEATVKSFYKENGVFRLQPHNSDYKPIIVNELDILGRVISVIRNYE